MLGLASILALLTCAPPAAAPVPDAAAIEREVQACQRACTDDPGRSETDRASCRLQCTATRRAHEIRTHGIRQETTIQRPTDAPSLDATRYVTVQPEAPVAGTGPYTTVIESAKSPAQIATCQLGCDQAGLVATDRATCKLNCAATTRIVHVVPAAAAVIAPVGAAADTPGVPAGSTLSSCYDGCSGATGSDAATCRLNCEASHRPRRSFGPAPGSSVVHRPAPHGGDPAAAAACERGCDGRLDLAPTDRATCKLGCSRHTSVVVEQWTTTAPPAAEQCQVACPCRQRCAGHRQACDSSCAGKAGSDAATCRLQCEAVLGSCTNACQVGGCACP